MKLKSTFENYLFILPAASIFSVFYIIPFFWVFWYSFLDWNGIEAVSRNNFVLFANFKEIITDSVWWQSLRQAGYITLAALTLQNALAFLLAWACDREIRLKNFYRLIFFIPPVLSEVVVGKVWSWILDGNYGILNHWLISLGLPNLARTWLAEPHTALPALAAVHCWKGFGWGFLIFLAGLQTIPRELYEAARVDGANAWQSFKKITLPMMAPVTALVMTLTILGTMQVFTLVYTMTRGGPGYHTEVPVTRIFSAMAESSRFGYACTQGIALGAILCLVSFAQYAVFRKVKA
jgi:ABC-type sugar transport system permease subunit